MSLARASIQQNAVDPSVEDSTANSTERIVLPDGLADRLRHRGETFISTLREQIRPLRLTLTITRGGVFLAGDEDARAIAHKAVTKLILEPSKFLDEAPDETRANTLHAVDSILRRDLAFRLDGLLEPVRPLTVAQIGYMRDLISDKRPLVFGVGPAGTGKTHMPLAAALHLLAIEKCKHIVVTRPHALQEGQQVTPDIRLETKMDDQFTPVLDILSELTSVTRVEAMRRSRELELVPTGLLRGRTFNNAIILVDEAQNLTPEHLRMAVTRLGQNSRLFITGDPAQCDLKRDEPSGLCHLLNMLNGSELACVHTFEPQQIVSSSLAAQLETLYAEHMPKNPWERQIG